jgi:hypothetical protein
MSIITWYTLQKGNRQTETLISLTKSFTTISIDLKVILTKIDEYERQNERGLDLQKDMIALSLKGISDRMEKLEKSTSGIIASLDSDINKLYLYCSKKIERDNANRSRGT